MYYASANGRTKNLIKFVLKLFDEKGCYVLCALQPTVFGNEWTVAVSKLAIFELIQIVCVNVHQMNGWALIWVFSSLFWGFFFCFRPVCHFAAFFTLQTAKWDSIGWDALRLWAMPRLSVRLTAIILTSSVVRIESNRRCCHSNTIHSNKSDKSFTASLSYNRIDLNY